MKPYITAILSVFILIMLQSLQLCLFSYHEHSQFNPVLIAYLYILLTNCSITLLTALAIMMETITCLVTGIFGLTILFLVPASWLALKIKDDMYNKIAIPCSFIFFHAIFYNIVLKIYIASSISVGQIAWTTIINSFGFLGIWYITKQPFHD